VAADRVTGGRKGPNQILVLNPSGDIAFRQLVDTAKLRLRIEREYHELKQEVPCVHAVATTPAQRLGPASLASPQSSLV
jgi:hypothetical protein